MLDVVGSGEKLIAFIENELKLPISEKAKGYLTDDANPYQMYDLLGWIKSQLISKFYVPATDELPNVREMLEISDKIGAISAAA